MKLMLIGSYIVADITMLYVGTSHEVDILQS